MAKPDKRRAVPLGVVEAVNGNIKALLRRGRGCRDLVYLLLKAQRLTATPIYRFPESRIECASLQFLVQNRKKTAWRLRTRCARLRSR
jgi:hypothetical protein